MSSHQAPEQADLTAIFIENELEDNPTLLGGNNDLRSIAYQLCDIRDTGKRIYRLEDGGLARVMTVFQHIAAAAQKIRDLELEKADDKEYIRQCESSLAASNIKNPREKREKMWCSGCERAGFDPDLPSEKSNGTPTCRYCGARHA